MASNFVYSDAAGTKDKAARVAELKQMAVSDDALADPAVVPSGNHAIVTYTLSGRHYMSVWQQQKSGWVMVAMSASH